MIKESLFNEINQLTKKILIRSISDRKLNISIAALGADAGEKGFIDEKQILKDFTISNSVALSVNILSKIERHLNMKEYGFYIDKTLVEKVNNLNEKFFDEICMNKKPNEINHVSSYIHQMSRKISSESLKFVIEDYYPYKKTMKNYTYEELEKRINKNKV
jgi:hypothetical protein